MLGATNPIVSDGAQGPAAARKPRRAGSPAHRLEGWRHSFVQSMINGIAPGRCTLKSRDDDRRGVQFALPMCVCAGVDTGDRVNLSLSGFRRVA